MEMVRYITLGSILLVQSVYDMRKKLLPLWITLVGAAVGIIILFLEGKVTLYGCLGIIPGILCLVYARVSREVIGYGDGLLIGMMGIYLPISKLISCLMWAFLMAGILGLYLLVTKKKQRKQTIPFVPFLFVGFVLEVALC